jgi:hypothetical protein
VDVYRQKADLLASMGISGPADTIWEILHFAQAWNGFGYETGAGRATIPASTSPFLWSFSQHYVSGKYAADGFFRRDLVDEQCGVAVILHALAEMGVVSFGEDGAVGGSVTWPDPVAEPKPYAPAECPCPFPGDATAQPGEKSEYVRWVIRALMGLGFLGKGDSTDVFNANAQDAVRWFQRKRGLDVDGEPGPLTRGEMVRLLVQARGRLPIVQPINNDTDLRGLVAAVAYEQASKGRRHAPDNEIDQAFLDPLRPALVRLKQWPASDTSSVFDWCACWVTGIYRACGVRVPDIFMGFWATVALTDSWIDMAKRTGSWTQKAAKGNAALFDWPPQNGEPNHIGIVLEDHGDWVLTAEGNSDKIEAIRRRDKSLILGYVDVEILRKALEPVERSTVNMAMEPGPTVVEKLRPLSPEELRMGAASKRL